MRQQGKNSEIVHREQRYHIQTESWAPTENILVTQVFKSGRLILKRKHVFNGVGETFTDQDIENAHSAALKEFKALLI